MPGHSCKRFTNIFNTVDVLYIRIKPTFYGNIAFFIISVKYIELCMRGCAYIHHTNFIGAVYHTRQKSALV
jgi:hypothetical protein